ncbi:helix-turn-helix domain-containing protein [Neobacillus sp. NPDC093182]|uniref:helix-turn-helix domain-containing protein n=1 Tax=Neobacillus sp. NPDC093182 TaxID=3364297 RepID=UPI003806F1F7
MEDLPELIQLFLQEFASKYKKPVPNIVPEVMVTFMHLPWNDNIRQLKNTIERLVILADGNQITSAQLPSELVKQAHRPHFSETAPGLHGDERSNIFQALQKTYGNKSAAAKLLGISRVTLNNKIEKYGL